MVFYFYVIFKVVLVPLNNSQRKVTMKFIPALVAAIAAVSADTFRTGNPRVPHPPVPKEKFVRNLVIYVTIEKGYFLLLYGTHFIFVTERRKIPEFHLSFFWNRYASELLSVMTPRHRDAIHRVPKRKGRIPVGNESSHPYAEFFR